ncbi:hypothetical protein GCM10009851_35470 [Herbiconiux moechotypicola]|uniref:HTH tetR-type domain-containing protein n=1 Tax=Herbiconiux moechotypicola TaxID=637393 RepID=A0ABN3E2Y8_9MICO
MRQEMAEAALEMMIERGYEALTVDELARGVGVSRATFFRYLGSKDEAIISALIGPVDQFSRTLRASPIALSGSLWSRLRIAFEPALLLAEADPQRQRQRMTLIQSLPAVGARLRRERAPQIDALAEALTDSGVDRFGAAVVAAAGVAALDRCWVVWMHDEDESLRAVLDRAVAELERASLRHP